MTLKQDRMAEKIRAVLSDLVLREVSDPRLKSITVTEVKIDAEIEHATVYVNALGNEDRREEVMEGLAAANGFLRRELGKRISTRNTPELHFEWDETLEHGERINQILDDLHIEDEDDIDEGE